MDKILADAFRAHPDITVTDLSRLNCCRPGLLPAFLQDGRDVHGSHGLFYWLRARQRGLVVSQEHAGVVLAWWRCVPWAMPALRRTCWTRS
jgi:hypothetical protein